MKRIFTLILCILLVIALCAGCTVTSGKDGNNADDAQNAAEQDAKEPASDAAEPAEEKGDSAAPSEEEHRDAEQDATLPEIEIPFDEDVGDELIDPDEIAGSSETEAPDFVPDEGLITGNDDIRIDENGDVVLPELP